MTRSRALLLFALGLALVVSATPQLAADDAEVAALMQKIDALEKRISTMERNLTNQLRNIQNTLARQGAGGAANNALEAEAQAAFGEISRERDSGDPMKAKTQMTAFLQKYGATNTAKKARALSRELAVIGKTAPTNWGIEKWFQGENDVDLNSGNTLLVFWETWCGFCQREVPKLEALYNTLKGDGLQVVGLTKITKSSTEQKVTEFISTKKLSYPVAKENGTAAAYFNVSGIPAAVVMKDGKVIWRGHPAKLTQARLKSWL